MKLRKERNLMTESHTVKDKYIMYDHEVIKTLNLIKEMILDKRTKTRFDHVRGNVENKEIMIDAIDRAICIIRDEDFIADDMNPFVKNLTD